MENKSIPPVLTDDQIADIKKREAEAIAFLQSKHLIVDAVVYKVNIGDGTFADKVIPYLQDTLYSRKVPVTTFDPNEPAKKTP